MGRECTSFFPVTKQKSNVFLSNAPKRRTPDFFNHLIFTVLRHMKGGSTTSIYPKSTKQAPVENTFPIRQSAPSLRIDLIIRRTAFCAAQLLLTEL
jgi:hypothetical protein